MGSYSVGIEGGPHMKASPTDARRVHVLADREALAQAAAGRWAALAAQAIGTHGAFHVALAGGRTPRGLHRQLAAPQLARRVNWSRVHVYLGDERCVPPDHPSSNYRMIEQTLLRHVPIAPDRVHPIDARLAYIRQGAHAYAGLLRECLPRGPDRESRFDLVVLGLGADGHIASLFPRSCALRERERLVTEVYAGAASGWRVTLTFRAIEAARRLMFIAAGAEKAGAVREALAPRPDRPRLPVQMLHSAGEVEWFLDAAAARLLPGVGS
jgi:6-phosphogluconolactonase